MFRFATTPNYLSLLLLYISSLDLLYIYVNCNSRKSLNEVSEISFVRLTSQSEQPRSFAVETV